MGSSLVIVAIVATAACGRVGFDVGNHDDAVSGDGPLTVQPFSLTMTGAFSFVRGVAPLPDGGVALIGAAIGPFDFNGVHVVGDGAIDVVIAALAPDHTLRWIKVIGSPGSGVGTGIATAPDGTIFTTGAVSGPVDFGGGMLVPQNTDAFVASYAMDGTYRWSRLIGGPATETAFGSDVGQSVAAAPNGDVIVGGQIRGAVSFGNGVNPADHGGTKEAFVARLDGASGLARWAQRWGANGAYSGTHGVATDANNQVFAAGYYEGSTSFGAAVRANAGGHDAMIVALDSAGGYRWDHEWTSAGNEEVFGVQALGGRVIAAGVYSATIGIGTVPASRGLIDGVVVTYDDTGAVAWTLAFGASGCDALALVSPAGAEIAFAGAYSGTIDLGTGPLTAQTAADALVFTTDLDGHPTWSASFDAGGIETFTATAGTRDTQLVIAGITGLGFTTTCDDMNASVNSGQGLLRGL